MNVNKTVAMLFHTKQKRANIDENLIVIDGNIISLTTNTKFLVINISISFNHVHFYRHAVLLIVFPFITVHG